MEPVFDLMKCYVEDFQSFDDWFMQCEYLVDLGKNLELTEDLKSHIITKLNCASRLWFKYGVNQNHIVFSAYSESAIINGYIFILQTLYNNQPIDLLSKMPPTFLSQLGYEKLLVGRKNTLLYMANTLYGLNSVATHT